MTAADPLLGFPEVPAELIAQNPAPERDQARLMVLNRADGSVAHERFAAVENLLRPGDVLVLNDARVFPARLTGRKPTGGRVRVLLVRGEGKNWLALLTPAQRAGTVFRVADGLEAESRGKRDGGEHEIVFSRPLLPADLERLGRMPLPPYIRRSEEDDPSVEALDRAFYQTVYAQGGAGAAVAAPTAGLHFTEALLDRLRAKGVETVSVTLDVGWGTFRPVAAADYRDHVMLPEDYRVSEETSARVQAARARGGRVWAVGTTAVRTLESAADEQGVLRPGRGAARLYIHPGYRFKIIDALITNFHLPRHTPLLLACAFAGADVLRRAYVKAVEEKYRFFSYGDAMAVF